MSWFSKLTHTEGLTPSFLKPIGDIAGGLIVKAVPGGGLANSIFDFTNSSPEPRSTFNDLLNGTLGNLGKQKDAALAAAQRTADGQAAVSDAKTGAALFLSSPVGLAVMIGAVILVVLLVRKR